LYKNTVMLLLGYRLQELKLGGLSSGARRHLNSFLSRTNGGKAARPTRRLKPGTRLQRSWQGRTHIVTVADDGFEYAGQTYASLSVIARPITGTAWSGPAFFGLKGTATKRATA
jgi:hypothetical protein